jgi:hypothetical protein
MKKGFVSYFKNKGIITLKKYANANHKLIAKKIEEEMNNMKSPMEKQLAIFNFGGGGIYPFKKDNVYEKMKRQCA